MSTICKLDRTARLDRYLRKMQLREMQDDLRTISGLIDRGHSIKPSAEGKTAHRRIMADMILKRTILAMTLEHLRKVFRDPSRTGERKEAIFQKLSASPQSTAKGVE